MAHEARLDSDYIKLLDIKTGLVHTTIQEVVYFGACCRKR
jgi:hypothetical protein